MKTVPVPRTTPARYGRVKRAGDDYGVTDGPDWRQVDWLAHLHRIEVAGSPVSYVDIGEDREQPPIVFIHGLSGQWQNWLENIPRFAEQRRVIAMDLPGFGLSPMPAKDISIELYGHVVAELCERIELGPAVFVGNSMGGFVAAEVATRRSQVVERLMLVSAAGVSQMDLARRPMLGLAKAATLLATSNVAQMRMAARRPRLRHWILALVARYPGAMRGDLLFEGFMKGSGKPGFEQALIACMDYDFRDRLEEIRCPVLVVWGDKDMVIPVQDADRFVELIPGAHKVILDDTGHVPMAERPPTFNRILQEFLEQELPAAERAAQLDRAG